MQVEWSATPLLAIDEVKQIHRKRVGTIIVHVFQLTYAAYWDKLVQEEKVNRCQGCAIQHPSQRQHSCQMLNVEDAWFYYHDDAREQIDLAAVMKTVESVCSTQGLKLRQLSQTWESYLMELPKLPQTTLYLTSLELQSYDEDIKERVLHALYYGPCGLNWANDFSSVEIHKDDNFEEVMNVDPIEVQCPWTVVRKEQKLMELDYVQ